MHLKLPSDYVLPPQQIPLPNAVAVIWDVEYGYRRGDLRLMMRIFGDASSINIAQPVAEYQVSLGPGERGDGQKDIEEALYNMLLLQPEYEDAYLEQP